MGFRFPSIILWVGFSIQAVGGTMLVLNIRADIGAWLQIIFTVMPTIIFHRFWNIGDHLRRHLYISFVFSIIAIIRALLLII